MKKRGNKSQTIKQTGRRQPGANKLRYISQKQELDEVLLDEIALRKCQPRQTYGLHNEKGSKMLEKQPLYSKTSKSTVKKKKRKKS